MSSRIEERVIEYIEYNTPGEVYWSLFSREFKRIVPLYRVMLYWGM